ncbi:L-serine ammonia-lyase, iron-sulfur-dependent, subunit beta [Tumebacillus algifaecis]|uniref:L-serine deaminase n=1 Tax=Tumebacillus algifaecis TaxID=1214604 RepID=A0A223D2J5_9BACL|nr:L-serine ammonia-lyase, iron-sulfur-dependent subunit beta [Tumebacillus algifaecis]ASS75715.1 L-serine ammonia-lyase, iron-sulfur-dependent, subunit beta [Tumebacillus algifaecis]
MSSFRHSFDIIGPVMIGPSSSHTAGAARLGRSARGIFGEQPDRVEITLFGSFAKTYKGHGTDVALVAGLLDFETHDPRIPRSLHLAQATGMNVAFIMGKPNTDLHPNTVHIKLNKGARQLEMLGCSIGGGAIEILEINQFKVKITASYPTLVIPHTDQFGVVAAVTAILSKYRLNISAMEVARRGRGRDALMVIGTDERPNEVAVQEIAALEAVQEVAIINPS